MSDFVPSTAWANDCRGSLLIVGFLPVYFCVVGVRPPSRAVFDPRVGLVTAQLESLSLMGGGGGMGVGVGGGSGGVAAGRVLVHEAKLVSPPEKDRRLGLIFPIVSRARYCSYRVDSVALTFLAFVDLRSLVTHLPCEKRRQSFRRQRRRSVLIFFCDHEGKFSLDF